jgi:NADPH:quinone reductase-like Zn-dependent oxidoreductase
MATMRAAVMTRYGGSEALEVREMPRPEPGAGEVLVRQVASSMNPLDWKLRRGKLRFLLPLKLPAILGFDVSGSVEAVGKGASRFAPGEAVFGSLARPGAHAEFVAIPESGLARKPASLSFEEAAAVPGAALTALMALRDVAELKPGQSLLVNGGTGGVGSFAIQIGKAFGARVTATGGPGSITFLLDLGSERALDYARENFVKGTDRWDVIFDVANATSFFECAPALTPRGVWVTTMPGPGPFFARGLSLVGGLFGYGKRCRWVIVRPDGERLEALAKLADEGKLRPALDSVFPLAEIRKAHERLESGHPRGKIVVRIG